ncbi:sensor histidine kinase [Clostridium aciditolerans]|uniref:histidine kinase n=1 Tax=Clostridium aciditolerans TaxID=339861 RepID=A0A934HX61_9CLOT|nr:sensor histidine kinase [Clostridium aciditolerans]MBI6872617.1 sensor histidine kinase [Clostridium aciditolerans]
MRKKMVSLKTVVAMYFISFIIIILSILAILWKADYNWLAKEQGDKILKALNENTQQSLRDMLSKPLEINQLFAGDISREKYFNDKDLNNIEDYTKYFLEKIKNQMPQVTAIGYGDERGNYVGIRVNDNNALNLMLKDKRTENKLNIYNKEILESRISTSYEGYDPRTRPWYIPVKKTLREQWSDIYINNDEKMEATISTLVPVFDNSKNFKGVTCIDINLSRINKFLKANETKGTGVIYIVDKNWNLIAHSGDEAVMKITQENPNANKMVNAAENKNILISKTAKYLQENRIAQYKTIQINIENEQNFALISPMEEPQGLEWRVVVVIPEKDLMGTIKARQNITIAIILIITIIGALAGLVILKRIINPILESSKAAFQLSSGNWDVKLDTEKIQFNEIYELSIAFNYMSANLKKSFNELVEAQDEIKRLNEAEKQSLENLVLERTQELRIAMKELIDKEKLASLGSLVSGVAHEINTPLGVSVSAASYLESINKKNLALLSEGKMTKKNFVEYINSIDESSKILNVNLNRASELIKSFKAIAVNQIIEEKTNFNLYEYIQTVLLSLKHEYKNTNHQFIINCDKDLVINSYSGAFSQVIVNLIMNSLIHGFKDKKDGTIKIDINKNDDKLSILYSDNGCGISGENIQKIFDPFFTTNRNKGGSGLGLNVVYNLITGPLNGKIVCESVVGQGTTFKINISLSQGVER